LNRRVGRPETANRVTIFGDWRGLPVSDHAVNCSDLVAGEAPRRIPILRHQLNVLRRATPWRVALTNLDHGLFVAPYRA
jgi:hypothetical protein